MSIEAWPYAVGRGFAAGYQIIVLPNFLAAEIESYVLEYASTGESTPAGTVIAREIEGAGPGPLTLLYRVIQPTACDFAPGEGEPLRDIVGRPTRLFEGFVVRASLDATLAIPVSAADFDLAHRVVAPAFQSLWKSNDTVAPASSGPTDIGSAGAEPSPLLEVVPIPPYPVRKEEEFGVQLSAPGLIASVVLVAVVAFVIWALVDRPWKVVTPTTPSPISNAQVAWNPCSLDLSSVLATEPDGTHRNGVPADSAQSKICSWRTATVAVVVTATVKPKRCDHTNGLPWPADMDGHPVVWTYQDGTTAQGYEACFETRGGTVVVRYRPADKTNAVAVAELVERSLPSR